MADRGWNYYTLQCGAIMTLILPSDCTLQQGFFKDQFRTAQFEFHGERGARAYNGGLGVEPLAGVQGAEPPVGGQGAKPP